MDTAPVFTLAAVLLTNVQHLKAGYANAYVLTKIGRIAKEVNVRAMKMPSLEIPSLTLLAIMLNVCEAV